MRDGVSRSIAIGLTITGTLWLLSLGELLILLPDRAVAVSLTALATSMSFIVLSFGLAALSGERVSTRLGLHRGVLSSRSVGILVLGTLALSHALETIVSLLGLSDVGALAQLEAALEGRLGAVLLLEFLCIAVMPGIGEELLFRGLLQRGLQRQFGNRRGAAGGAILVSAGLFGLVHADFVHSPAAFVLGAYIGVVAWRAQSIRPAILCHVANNAFALLGSAFQFEFGEGGAVLSACGALAIAGGAVWIALRGTRGQREGLPPSPRDPLVESREGNPVARRPQD